MNGGIHRVLVRTWVAQAVRWGRFADEQELRRAAFTELGIRGAALDQVAAAWRRAAGKSEAA